MSVGYVYCFSNPLMPGIYKVGMTTRTPEARLKDANSSNTWKPPVPYQIELSKKVNEPYRVETSLHLLLERFLIRIHPRREFFRGSFEDIKLFFNLIEGKQKHNKHYIEPEPVRSDISEISSNTVYNNVDKIKEEETEEPSDDEINMNDLCVSAAETDPLSSNIFQRFAYKG